MKKIIELVAVINRNKTKSISIIGDGQDTKLNRFYKLIAQGQIPDDDIAFELLYPGEKDKNPYYKLKHELKDRLYSTAFFIDTKRVKYSSVMSAFIECQWLVCLANILNALRARQNMMDVCKKALRIAEKYEFTIQQISLLKVMLNYYKISGDTKAFKACSLNILQKSVLSNKEVHAYTYWAVISSEYLKNKSVKSDLAELSIEYTKALEEIESEEASQLLYYYSTMIKASRYLIRKEFGIAVPILKSGLHKISQSKNPAKPHVYGLAINLSACYIAQKKYQEGEELIELLYQNTDTGSFNWYKTREMHFILLVHTRQYKYADEVFQGSISEKTFKKLPSYMREIWSIYGAYLEILRNAGLLERTEASRKSFRVNRYLNDLPTFSRDKRGQNVPVLISHIVLLLQHGKEDQLIDRFEAIGKYRNRYVKKDDNFRANVFLRMLNEIVRNDFNRIRTVEGAKEYRAMISTVSTDMLNQNYDHEVMPYEDLWDIITPLLD